MFPASKNPYISMKSQELNDFKKENMANFKVKDRKTEMSHHFFSKKCQKAIKKSEKEIKNGCYEVFKSGKAFKKNIER